ncbi:MAG: YraN family protein [Planctomycetes bacterium]|nr:YraN family protein [Planctomycetota bacterium]
MNMDGPDAKQTLAVQRAAERMTSGRNAEDAAADLLESKGCTIAARNLRLGHLEIDLLATRPGTNLLILVEVKARRAGTHAPELRVDRVKQRRLVRAAEILLSRRMFRGYQVRFDVVAVEMDRNQRPMNLRHIERAFDA